MVDANVDQCLQKPKKVGRLSSIEQEVTAVLEKHRLGRISVLEAAKEIRSIKNSKYHWLERLLSA